MKKTEAELLENQWDVENMEVDPEVLAKYVRYDVDEERAVATITFDRPERLNAIPVAAFERVGDLVREAEADDRVKVIVFKGEGEHFGTGADAAELGHYIGYKTGTDKASRRRPAQRQRILPDRNVLSSGFTRPIIESLKATICQVQGYCYGGHFQIALSADIVIASPDARFTHPAFRYLGPAPQDMYHWIEKVGLTTMKDVMLTMRAIGAEEGERKGLVTKVVAPRGPATLGRRLRRRDRRDAAGLADDGQVDDAGRDGGPGQGPRRDDRLGRARLGHQRQLRGRRLELPQGASREGHRGRPSADRDRLVAPYFRLSDVAVAGRRRPTA